MPRKAPWPPRIYQRAGKEFVRVRLKGQCFDRVLGPADSPEARQAYLRLVSEMEAAGGPAAPPPLATPLTVAELVSRFLAARAQESDSRDTRNYATFARPLLALYGNTPAAEFGPKALRATMHAMAAGTWGGRSWTRGVVNRSAIRIRTMFRWAESEELLPAGTYHALATVPGLRRGAPGVRERKPVTPSTWDEVLEVSRHCPPPVATMLQAQFWAGCRSQEIRLLRTADLDTADPECWLYRVRAEADKTAHLDDGRARVVAFGPFCIRLLRPWLRPDAPEEYVFSPARWAEDLSLIQRSLRRSPLTPSQRARLRKPRRWGACYTRHTYAQAVRRACEMAGVRLHAYQGRHASKERVTREHGLDAARAFLGQRSLGVTNQYAARQDLRHAKEVAKKMG